MELRFERGDAAAPLGHAILFFSSARDPSVLAACYLIVPPIQIDLTRYMPPLLSGHIPAGALKEVQAVPLPPVPERVPSRHYVEKLARLRNDDLLDGGVLDLDNLERCLTTTAELAQLYLQRYRSAADTADAGRATPDESRAESGPLELGVDNVLDDLLGDHDRLTELAKLVGVLRYAVGGADQAQIEETQARMHRLARRLPEKYRASELISAAARVGSGAEQLAELFVERGFRLAAEDYRAVAELDRRIAEQRTSP